MHELNQYMHHLEENKTHPSFKLSLLGWNYDKPVSSVSNSLFAKTTPLHPIPYEGHLTTPVIYLLESLNSES
jgi:hypothetical protein